MNNSKQPLEALRDELHNLEKGLRQVKNQDQCSRIEADFLLDQIRKLYAAALDLQQTVTDQPPATENHNQKRAGHQEEKASHEQDQADKPVKHNADDNQPKTDYQAFTPGQEEGNYNIPDDGENKQERTSTFKQSDNTTSDWETTAHTHERTISSHEDPQEEHGNETPVEKGQANDENSNVLSEQPPGETTTPEAENAEPADQKAGDSGQKPDFGAKDLKDQSEWSSTQERYQNQRGQALHEKFEGKQISLHEQLVANNSGKSLLDRFKNAPIDDLRSAIGLNERAKFIKELFDGKRQAYFDTIEALNRMGTYNEALQYLEYTVKPAHQWDNHQKAVEDFMELVYRRFVSSDA